MPDVARILTTEMGKTFASARGEVSKCALGLRWFAEHAEALLADEPIATGASRSYVHYQPIGPVLAIMPWNFPMWQVVRFAAPALMVGNVGLLKHASNVPQTALVLEDLFRRAGLPEGVFTNLFVESKDVAKIIEDPRIAAVTLTGSERAGMSVALDSRPRAQEERARARWIRPVHRAGVRRPGPTVRTAVEARVQNNGQSCIAAKRFIVVEPVADEFLRRFTEAMDALVVGDPFDPATDVGPIVTEAQRAEIGGQVEEARSQGATVHSGGAGGRRPRVVLPADGALGHHVGHAGGPGGALRARGHGRAGAGSDRRPRGGQRHDVRTRLERVGDGRGGDPALHRGTRGRGRLRQRHGGVHARAPLRRDQAIGLRPGALRAGLKEFSNAKTVWIT